MCLERRRKISIIMEYIFHERQEGSLCAQHCLNTLLQGQYFSAVDLADIARQLDETERLRMAEGGLQSSEYNTFLQQPSGNFDDSGFFSIQVLQKALSIWGLDLLPFNSSDQLAIHARDQPTGQRAYICNFKEHWFTIRRLGNQWFNINSLLTGPELISDTYLSLFLTQLQQEGYDIFIVLGELPASQADQVLRLMPATQTVKPRLISDEAENAGAGGSQSIQEDDLQRALQASMQECGESEEEQLQAALAMSVQGIGDIAVPSTSSGASAAAAAPTPAELRAKRLAFLERVEAGECSNSTSNSLMTNSEDHDVEEDEEEEERETRPKATKLPSELTEDEMLQAAIQMSMEST